VQSSPVSDRILFMGMQTNIADWLAAWDVFVLPSGPEESFGNAVVEAMACGLSVVVSADCPAHREHVRHQETGIIVEDVDALVRSLQALINSPELRTSIGQAAASFVRSTYTMGKMLERYDQLYSMLCKRV
jgi:glycosyltransferase involved in cell wall biosynthesis